MSSEAFREMKKLDREVFRQTVKCNAVCYDSEKDIRDIIKIVKRLGAAVKFKRFNHIQKEQKRVIISSKYELLSDEAKEPLTCRWSIVATEVELEYKNLHLSEIMDLVFGSRVTAFNTVGHIIQLNLKSEAHFSRRHLIGEILLDQVPQARTVVAKNDTLGSESKTANTFRILPMEIVAGEKNLETTHTEHGNKFELDLGETYWNSRLQEEHKIMAELIEPDSYVIDLCCGIGPFVIPIAKRGINVLANDLNPGAVKWLKRNVELNLKQNDFIKKVKLGRLGKNEYGRVECLNEDGHEIIRKNLVEFLEKNNQKVEILMNLPGGALFFLPTFKEVKEQLDSRRIGHDVLLHLYTFGPKHGNSEEERTTAHEEVKKSVRENYGAEIEINSLREVRDISTKCLQYCVDIRLTGEAGVPEKRLKL